MIAVSSLVGIKDKDRQPDVYLLGIPLKWDGCVAQD
jgi:hypothetical protein